MASPEFSFVVTLSALPETGAAYELEATEGERAALAERLDLVELGSFRATLRLARVRGGEDLLLTGRIGARVVQRCVVTLEPVEAEIDAPLAIRLRPAGALSADLAPDEDVEPYEGDTVDLGEIAAQELSLALDPYPRAPEAGTRGEASQADQTRAPGPFDALAALRPRK